MSGPLDSDEIEDVVSSVRRLISPEARPRTRSRDPGAERLLLTPALQVVGGSEVVGRLLLTVPVEDRPMPDGAANSPEGPVLAGAASPDMADHAVPDAPFVHVATASDPNPVFGTDIEEGLDAQSIDGEWDGAFWSQEEPDLAELALTVEEAELVELEDEVIEAVTAALTNDAVAAQELDPIAAVLMSLKAEVLPAEAAAPVMAEPAGAAVAETVSAVEEVAQAAEPAPTVETTPVVEDAPAHEPGPDLGDVVPFPVIMQPAPPVPDLAEAPAAVSPAAPEPAGDPAKGAAALDEAALAQLVRALIREELQGALGERITQNVRKLVRAEINRALAARSLD